MPIYTVPVNSDGSGTGSASSAPIRGYLLGIKFLFGGTPAATTDTVVTEANGMGRTLLTLTNVNTNGVYNPQAQSMDGTGTPVTFYTPYYLNGPLTITIAQAVASTLAAVTAIINTSG